MPRPRQPPRQPPREVIEIVGAREHNLRIDRLTIPKRSFVVFTGPSGSGKSSLAFDTLYAEGQRRYIETLSAYARQFLGQLDRPKVDALRGLSPTVAIEQKTASSNPRSTIGTITEVSDYLRVLYAKVGVQHCVDCGKKVGAGGKDAITREIAAFPDGTRLLLLAPLVKNRKGEFAELFEDLAARGFVRVEIDGVTAKLEALPPIDKKRKHTVSLVVDRLSLRAGERARLVEAVMSALLEGKGEMAVRFEADGATRIYSEARSCCGRSYAELSPAAFSFNSPLGMCPECNGLGRSDEVDPKLVVPDPSLSIRGGAIAPWASALARGDGWTARIADAVSRAFDVDLDVPWKKLPTKKRDAVLYGVAGEKVVVKWGKKGAKSQGAWEIKFDGVVPNLMRRFRETSSEAARENYRKFVRERVCSACGGKRLRREILAVTLGSDQAAALPGGAHARLSIAELSSLSIAKAHAFVSSLALVGADAQIAAGALKEVQTRLGFLLDVGLDYLALERGGPSLSGGEAQRIRLASQLGSELSGVLYVLDEPSIGLHSRDVGRLVGTLERLRDLGNTVIVVEHDEETVRAADHLIDFGPGAGRLGGNVLYEGSPNGIGESTTSVTGPYLTGARKLTAPRGLKAPDAFLTVRGARENNLKNIDVAIPLGVFTCITGVSGAGKSSLIGRILLPALSSALYGGEGEIGAHDRIEGIERLDKVIAIDQQPIGRTPRSNPGTYTKAFDLVRQVFAELPEARARGYGASQFSFNVKGGRCETCQGDGLVKVEMHFLADVYVTCESCGGKRYAEETLEVKFKRKSITDVLESSIEENLALFAAHPQLARTLKTLVDVGLGYMLLGQSAPTLSGGEAQRVKLSKELARRGTGRTLYVLDEPTTGLHFTDIEKLIAVLFRLVDAGNSVVVIEHNLDLVRLADWIIDLGPEGGNAGGYVVAEGTPGAIARSTRSHTGKALRGR